MTVASLPTTDRGILMHIGGKHWKPVSAGEAWIAAHSCANSGLFNLIIVKDQPGR